MLSDKECFHFLWNTFYISRVHQQEQSTVYSSYYVTHTDTKAYGYYSTIGCTNTGLPGSISSSLPVIPVAGTAITGMQSVGEGMNANSIQIRWQATDTAISSAMQIPTFTHTTSSTANGLSSGAKAGIGVGVSLGVLMLIVGIAFTYSLGKRRASPPLNNDSPTYKAELAADTERNILVRPPSRPQELDAFPAPQEMELREMSGGEERR